MRQPAKMYSRKLDHLTSGARAGAGRGNIAPALLLCCLTLLALAPGAEASGTGAITGTVVEHLSAGVEGIDVNLYKAGLDGEFVGTVKTKAGGSYEFASVPEGSYNVFFAPNREHGYVPQYYDDEPSYEQAQLVEVAAGVPRTGIDAKLLVGGKIFGRVTDSSGNPVKEARVEASGVNTAHEFVYGGSAETGADGEYTLAGLAEGEYKVSFEAPFGVNLVSQYFDEVHFESEAKAVAVEEEEGGPGQKADARLEVGGEIAGTVTDAVTHKPLAGIVAYAYSTRGGGARYGETNANGEYSIVGLEGGGTYIVSFFEESEYFEEGVGLYIELSDEGVGVERESTTPLNAALVPVTPDNAVAPVVSGAPTVAQPLFCSNGTWTGVTPLEYAYQWLRDGSAIAGATGVSYMVQAADQGHALSCEVLATNSRGRGAAKSNALDVPAPVAVHTSPPTPTPSPTPRLVLSSFKLLAIGGSARVHLSCEIGGCVGSIEVSEQIVVKHRRGGRTIASKSKVVLALGSYRLAAGAHGTFAVHLTKAGRRVLAHARHHRVTVTLVATLAGGAAARGAVLLKSS